MDFTGCDLNGLAEAYTGDCEKIPFPREVREEPWAVDLKHGTAIYLSLCSLDQSLVLRWSVMCPERKSGHFIRIHLNHETLLGFSKGESYLLTRDNLPHWTAPHRPAQRMDLEIDLGFG